MRRHDGFVREAIGTRQELGGGELNGELRRSSCARCMARGWELGERFAKAGFVSIAPSLQKATDPERLAAVMRRSPVRDASPRPAAKRKPFSKPLGGDGIQKSDANWVATGVGNGLH